MSSEQVTFLLVDDTEENLVALEALLEREGLTILKARSGFEALELLLVHEVALAFLDVHMPDMDGFELAELMRGAERTKHVPIIFLTAGARDPQRAFKGYETGAVDFLFKPIEPHVLRSKAEVFFELSRQRKQLAKVLHLNEMFMGILGHDLRNPLSTIVTGARLLERKVADEQHLRTLRRMISASDRMSGMIEQLLDLTRTRLGGGLTLVREPLDVRELVQRVVDELRGANPQREVRLEGVGDSRTAADPDRLLQLFSNLVGNALQHGAADTPVRVHVDGSGRDICVLVQNQGAIAEELLPTIFDPFRARSGASASGGLGLGLYIAREIARAHAGSVQVESSQAAGTCFTVRIPRGD